TTDTDYDGGADGLGGTAAEVEYLLQAHNHYFSPGLSESDVLGTFAGLRPLLRSRPGDPSSLTREFKVFGAGAGLLSVAGGKYTTYRHMAEVITDEVCDRLGQRRRCRTRGSRLDGAPAEDWSRFVRRETWGLRSHYHLSEESARHLVCRYGRR